MNGRPYLPRKRAVETADPYAVYSAMGLIARTPDGRPLGRMSTTAPLSPVREAFAYVWASPDEARAVAAAWSVANPPAWSAVDDIADCVTAARTAVEMGTAHECDLAVVAADVAGDVVALAAAVAAYRAEWETMHGA